MVATRRSKRVAPADPPAPASDHQRSNGEESISEYERAREQKIKENMQRMQKLGILDLSLKLKAKISASKRPKRNPSEKKTLLPSPGSTRRSSRLKTMVPVHYFEKPVLKEGKTKQNTQIRLKEGTKPEAYTEEHEKLLGDCKASWTLKVDGYGEDGKRIYDSIKGETCHQCRQKTLGHHTHCIKCNLVQGQLCGDCLYMRYGENVLEAEENPDWICPVCRGICNCSICRLDKGWMPTGNLYRKVLALGYKSVAHYLIHTRRSHTTARNEGDDIEGPEGQPEEDEFLQSDKSHEGLVVPEPDDSEDDKTPEGRERVAPPDSKYTVETAENNLTMKIIQDEEVTHRDNYPAAAIDSKAN